MKEEFNKVLVDQLADKSIQWHRLAENLNKLGYTTPRGLSWTSNNIGAYARKKFPKIAKRGKRSTSKGFYCAITQRRQCIVCKKIKSFKKFYWTRSSSGYYPRAECKICKNTINKNLINESRIDKNPSNYWQCDCFWVNPNHRKKCYKCGKTIDSVNF